MLTKKAKITSAVAGAALSMAAMQSAQASLIIDFRFSALATDTTMPITAVNANTDVTVQVWGTVIGTGTLGIGSSVFRAFSAQAGASPGAFTNVTYAGVTSAGFSPASAFNNIASSGTAQDVQNIDGIFDLGSNNGTAVATPPDAKARATTAPNSTVAPAYYVSQGGWTAVTGGASIELGTFVVHIGSLTNGGTTAFRVDVPHAAAGATWYENASTLDGKGGAKNGATNYSVGTTVTFVAPTVISGVYKYALTTNNDATLGTLNSKSLTVIGSNKNYNDPGPDGNYVPANGILSDYAVDNANLGVGGELPVLVLVDFNLGLSGKTIDQLEGLLTNAGDVAAAKIVGPNDADTDGQRALLLSQYPTFTAGTSLLFEFTSAPGAVSEGLHWGFDMTGTGISVNRTIIVPEPASLGLLALGGLGLLSRRRKSA